MTGIIGAMAIEVELLIAAMEQRDEKKVSGLTFYTGTLSGRDVVIAQSGVGKVNAAVCAQIMISVFGADRIINSGVAGGLHPDMRQCDFIIPGSFVQHDMDTSPIGDPVGFISGPDIIHIPADKDLSQKLRSTVIDSFGRDIFDGAVATGDQFIADAAKSAFIRNTFGADACDMEGGAIAHVCYMAGVPFAALRAISDNADGSAGLSYAEFAKSAAKHSSAAIIKFIERI